MYRILLIVVIICHVEVGFEFLHAQSSVESIFKHEFYQEKNDDNYLQPLKKEQFSLGVSNLPTWFWNIPSSSDRFCYLIGISDPEMQDAQKAYKQAFARALMQCSIMSEARISGVSDLYNKELQDKYEEYYTLVSNSAIQGTATVVDSFETKFLEKVLLVKLDRHSSEEIKQDVLIKIYKSNTNTDAGWYCTENTSCYTRNKVDTLEYRFIQDNNRYSTISIWNRDTLSLPAYLYEYVGCEKIQKMDSIGGAETLKLYNRGLWSGYFQSFLNSLQTETSNHNVHLKAVKEFDHKSNEESDFNSLTRNVVTNQLTCRIKQIKMLFGQLNVDISILLQ